MSRTKVITHGDKIRWADLTIDISVDDDLTPALDLQGGTIVGIATDAVCDATLLTFETCDTIGGTYLQEQDSDNAAISVTTVANTAEKFALQPATTAGFSQFVKIRSNANESADTVLRLYIKDVS